jgi:sortase (surface protein transpeptidase)
MAVHAQHPRKQARRSPRRWWGVALLLSCLLLALPSRDAAAPSTGASDAPVGVPVRLSIPTIQVDAAVEPAGLTASGAMEEPSAPDLLAWYAFGPRPGEPGNAVVAGHVDWTTRLAVFWHLRDLRPGDIVRVAADDGVTRTFLVTRVATYPNDHLPLIDVFGAASGAHLNLVTCAGAFDPGSRRYEETLVVSADYAEAEPATGA